MNPQQCTVRGLAAGLVWLVALVAWPSGHAQAARARVTGVSMQEAADELQVWIATSQPARYRQMEVRPQWVVIDVLSADLGIRAGTLPQRGGPVSRIRVGQFTPDVVRVVVELTNPVPVRLAPSPDGTALVVAIPGRGIDGQTSAWGAGSGRGGIAKMTAVTIWGTPDRPWVSITASGPVRYQLRSIEPDWVVVDVSKAQLALPSGEPPAGRGLVKQIRALQLTPGTVRVILELAQHLPVHIATSPDRAAIIVSLAVHPRAHPGSTQAQAGGSVPPVPNEQSAAGAMAGGSSAAGASSAPNVAPLPKAPFANVQQQDTRPPTSPAQAPGGPGRPAGDAYALGPEDVLEITVWGYPDMTRVVTVRPDGQVAVPLAGTVPAAGRSVERLTQDLTRAFARYIVNPQVTVIVKEFRKIRISVLGQVSKPGTYALPPGTRILDAISAASGLSDNAALTQAQLVRASGSTRPLGLDGLLVQQDMSQNLLLEPGDTLIIPEDTKNKFYVLGDVNHPGIYQLKGDVTVLQALAIAGGPVLHGTSTSTTAHIVRRVDPNPGPLAASTRPQNVQIIANGNGALITMDLQKMYRGDLRENATLQPGDVMVVPAPGVAGLTNILSIISTILLGFRL